MKRWKVVTEHMSGYAIWCLSRGYRDVSKPTRFVTLYRWRWQARLSAFLRNMPPLGVPILTVGIFRAWVEPVMEGDNVIPLRRHA